MTAGQQDPMNADDDYDRIADLVDWQLANPEHTGDDDWLMRSVPPVRPWKRLGDVKFETKEPLNTAGQAPYFRLSDGTEVDWENATAEQRRLRELWLQTYEAGRMTPVPEQPESSPPVWGFA